MERRASAMGTMVTTTASAQNGASRLNALGEGGTDHRPGDKATELGAREPAEVAADVLDIESGDDRARRRRVAADRQAPQRPRRGELPELARQREQHERHGAETEAREQEELRSTAIGLSDSRSKPISDAMNDAPEMIPSP